MPREKSAFVLEGINQRFVNEVREATLLNVLYKYIFDFLIAFLQLLHALETGSLIAFFLGRDSAFLTVFSREIYDFK